MNYFECLEHMIGTDKTIQRIRERLPEPATADFPYRRILLPPKPVFNLDSDPCAVIDIVTYEMEKVRVCWHGCVFWAWKCSLDGKIYI